MRNLIVFILGMIFAFPVIWLTEMFSPTSYTIRILDNSECESPKYTIATKHQSISVYGDQIDYDGAVAPNGAEAFIYVQPPYKESGEFTYKVMANYSNCATIQSDIRTVKSGWILYEFIDKTNIKHTVRAR
jgi:hypothetical protein